MIDRIVVASKNPDKVGEVEEVLAVLDVAVDIVRGLAWDDVEETEGTLEGNALLKARAVAASTGLPSLADDTGLEVDALGGAPGVHTARFAGPNATYAANVAKMLDVMAAEENRAARFRTVVALVGPDGTEILAEGSLQGSLARAPRGSGGFGYDPIFLVDHRTLAELESKEKNELSHRARALRALVDKLRARGLIAA